MSPRVPPAFPYEDGLPLDLGPHGALGPRDDVFGDLCAAPVGAPWKRLGKHQSATGGRRRAGRPGPVSLYAPVLAQTAVGGHRPLTPPEREAAGSNPAGRASTKATLRRGFRMAGRDALAACEVALQRRAVDPRCLGGLLARGTAAYRVDDPRLHGGAQLLWASCAGGGHGGRQSRPFRDLRDTSSARAPEGRGRRRGMK
jgi:hypothetical protein